MFKFYPFPGMAHICQVEISAAYVFHPYIFRFKVRRDRVGERANVFGAEIEVTAKPFNVIINDIIELRVLRRRFEMFRFELGIKPLFGFSLQLELQRFRDFRRFGFAWAVDPYLGMFLSGHIALTTVKQEF
jgi:hypothetical protein